MFCIPVPIVLSWGRNSYLAERDGEPGGRVGFRGGDSS